MGLLNNSGFLECNIILRRKKYKNLNSVLWFEFVSQKSVYYKPGPKVLVLKRWSL